MSAPRSSLRPSFFVVGAQKAGTTTLHDWLTELPDVRLPAIKETHFFSEDARYARGEGWYLSQFRGAGGAGAVAGEVDPEYLYAETAAGRLAAFAPEARVVAVLRDPLKRAWSHFQMTQARGLEPLGFAEALEAEAERLRTGGAHARMHFSYLDRGRYADHVERLQAALPAAAFEIVTFEALFHPETRLPTLERIVRFIGSRADVAALDLEQRSNAAHRPRWAWINGLLHHDRTERRRWTAWVPASWKERAWVVLARLNQRAAPAAAASEMPEVPGWVRAWADEQAAAVRTRLGVDVAAWPRRMA